MKGEYIIYENFRVSLIHKMLFVNKARKTYLLYNLKTNI
jgi:hypothetical protein